MSTPLPFSLPKEPTKSIIDVQINLFPDSPCVFIHNQTMSSADAAITRQVIENLPASSFLGKWAIGVTPDSPATDQPGPVRALATVYKEWHQGLDQHVTVNLDWVVTHHDNLVRRLATVHLYASGIESVREHRTGTLWFRQPGADTWTMTPNGQNQPELDLPLEEDEDDHSVWKDLDPKYVKPNKNDPGLPY